MQKIPRHMPKVAKVELICNRADVKSIEIDEMKMHMKFLDGTKVTYKLEYHDGLF